LIIICITKQTILNHILGRNEKGKNVTIITWFAPSLPYGYGPKDYNNLPGLILELTEKETTYYASKINITNGTETKIDFPKE
jgi:GLPGLI family protein